VGDRVFVRAVARKPAQVLGDPDIPHTVTYIDDFAHCLVTLGERQEALGEVWHVPSDETVTTRRFVEMVFREIGARPRLRAAPRWGLALAGMFNPTLRAVREQLYQSERPWVVDSSKFERAFGWRATSLPDAIRATVEWFRQEGAGGVRRGRRAVRARSRSHSRREVR
jgi:nucleoside-diphosphate-sugar epimerase